MDSQQLQEIILATIETVAKNTILNADYLTLINAQISYVDKFDNYYNFTYQKEEYTGFSITGEKYQVGDLVYVLRLNNDPTAKQMIVSKVNSYTNFDIELAINDSLEEIKDYVNQIDLKEKEISIIGNTVFTLNDDLTITPEQLSFAAQKSGNITEVIWYVDGIEQIADETKRLVVPNSFVENKDSIIVRVEDFNNSDIYDEITVIRAMAADTKLDFDLGLDSILLQKDEQGVIDYSKAILTPKVFSNGQDVTVSEGWEFEYKIENGNITIVKEQGSYKIIDMASTTSKISFFAKKNGNMYLQKTIYATIVSYSEQVLNISISNQNFVISKTEDDIIKNTTLSTTISARRGSKILKIHPTGALPLIGNASGSVIENENSSLTYSWDLNESTILEDINGTLTLTYTIENEEHSSDILWTTVEDGTSGGLYKLNINPSSVLKNGNNTFTPNQIEINSAMSSKDEDIPYLGYFKIYKTVDNLEHTLEYESETLESSYVYNITDENLKSIKIELLDENKKLLITEYCYANVNSNDFIETVTKTEKNTTDIVKIDGNIKLLVAKDETLEQTITNLANDTETTFTSINNKFSLIDQTIEGVTTTVSNHTSEIETINGEIVSQNERLESAEQKLTAEQWSLWFTEVVNNSTATSTKFTMDKNGLHIKGGGIDIINNAGTKVFYADSSGNLIINNLTANNGTFNGTVTTKKGTIGSLSISEDGFTYNGVRKILWDDGSLKTARISQLIQVPNQVDGNGIIISAILINPDGTPGSDELFTQLAPNSVATTGTMDCFELYCFELHQASDMRLKEDIVKLDDKIVDIWKDLQQYQFKFNDIARSDNKKHFGLIAQEVINVFEKHGLDYRDYSFVGEKQNKVDRKMYYQIDYLCYHMMTAKVLKVALDKIELLEAEIKKLKEENINKTTI